MLIYVSGPLQGSLDLASARVLYERVARAVEAAGHRAYVPHLHTDPELASGISSATVYERDVAALARSDVIVAHLGAPSTGVGVELALAHDAGLRMVGLRRAGESVSRFAEGFLQACNGELLTFDSDEELDGLLSRALQSHALDRTSKGPAAGGDWRPAARPGGPQAS